ncbi:hypothetical protein GCK72_004026 [Caenorhabditis remanei]|uniref:Uncharacterized protein n=1 Tax=Caenorhabditis remanei TaxID=31234 RepID=A0A6A5H8A7_CAERE|nr:hypothetical protein GCK72_004026 [Caenorhabditis remanei]KAF1764080.1 hypothetical protein GCK72_004026 [Caenorhabditis remanei]
MSSSTYQVSRSHKRPISTTEDAPPTKKTKTSTVPHATPEVVPRQSKKRSFTQMQTASREFEETDEMIVKKSEVKEPMDEFDEWIQDIEDYDGFECPDDDEDEDVEEVLENMQSVSLF